MTEITATKPIYKRLEIVIPAAVVAILVIGYSVAWIMASGTVRSQLTKQRYSGIGGLGFDYRAMRVGGYPFGMRVRLDGPGLTGNTWNWRAESVTASLSIFNLGNVTLSAPGTHEIMVDGRRIRINTDKAKSTAHIDPDDGWSVNIVAEDLSASLDGQELADISDLSTTMSQSFDDPANIKLKVAADAISIPAVPQTLQALQSTIDSLNFDGTLLNVDTLRRGRRRGLYPRLRIESSEVIWGPVNASMRGEIGLDRTSRAEGTLQLGIEAAEDLKQKLSTNDSALPSKTSIILEIIRRTSGSVPVTFNAGVVSLAGFPITTIPPLAPDGKK